MAESRDMVSVGNNVFELLKNDHRAISKMVEELLKSPVGRREGVLGRLDSAFTRHADIEQRLVYPSLQNFPNLSGLIREAFSEHEGIGDFLLQMESEDVISGSWQSSCAAFVKALDNHMDKEELVIFPLALEQLPEGEREKMKVRVQAEQRKGFQPYRHRDSRRAGPGI